MEILFEEVDFIVIKDEYMIGVWKYHTPKGIKLEEDKQLFLGEARLLRETNLPWKIDDIIVRVRHVTIEPKEFRGYMKDNRIVITTDCKGCDF